MAEYLSGDLNSKTALGLFRRRERIPIQLIQEITDTSIVIQDMQWITQFSES